ncbi:hypothetical protein [uncultured Photobacterium sp.]|uniref:hypothetical protein n=1 Tax=uncultured Photobacterium sp. TaxID=173973 RepID=UPI00260986E5|nr:hypothetical protein [uncultured Photobacterium sp.]
MSKEIISFQDVLMVKGAAEGQTYFSLASDTLKRQRAVVSALELIKADVSASYSTGGTGTKGSYALEQHMQNLSEYTDCILNAMNGSHQD